jgi:hypothetical protein
MLRRETWGRLEKNDLGMRLITALEAQAAASLFLSDNLPDRFLASSSPKFDGATNVWRVPRAFKKTARPEDQIVLTLLR